MTFLDTVDGKLARVTLTYTKFGNLFDHLTDLIHPPFWWLAWIVGLEAAGMPLAHPTAVSAVIVGGYVLQRIQEGLFQHLHGMHIHVWRPFDSAFRQVIARRNPNLVLLTAATAPRRARPSRPARLSGLLTIPARRRFIPPAKSAAGLRGGARGRLGPWPRPARRSRRRSRPPPPGCPGPAGRAGSPR